MVFGWNQKKVLKVEGVGGFGLCSLSFGGGLLKKKNWGCEGWVIILHEKIEEGARVVC